MSEFLRQLDILPPDAIVYPVTIIGLGGIGSHLPVELAKIGFRDFTLYDDDRVEPHNIPIQFFRKEDIGKLKAEAAAQILKEFSPRECKVEIWRERFSGQRNLEGIVISGVDSMISRATIWKSVKSNFLVPLYIDGRTGGELFQIFSIRPWRFEERESYEKYLFPDSEGANLPCTGQGIYYLGLGIASFIASQVKKYIMEDKFSRYISYNFKTEKLIKNT